MGTARNGRTKKLETGIGAPATWGNVNQADGVVTKDFD